MNINCKEEILLKKYLPNKETVKDLSTFFSAFGDETRLRIVILLTIKPMCVGDITKYLSINQTTISHQLKILKSNNIVDCDRAGKNIIYYISNSNIKEMLNVTVDCI